MTAKQVMDELRKHSWTLTRVNGSHYVFEKAGQRSVTVPFHGNRDIGILAKVILKQASIKD